jgi:general secretion pathway protein D
MRHAVRGLLALGWALAFWWCVDGTVRAQENPTPPEGADTGDGQRLITMDFQDVDIAVLVKFISELTGKNFIVDEKVRGKITIISPGKISVDEAYTVFQSVLQVKGFTTVPAGAVIKIIPTKEARSSTLETVLPNRVPQPIDEYITRLVPLKHVDANNMVAILQPLVSPDGLLAAYAPTNTLILIDTAAQTDRLTKILGQLDVEGFEQGIEVIRLNYAFAADMAALLQQVLEEEGGPGATGGPAVQPGAAPDARLRRGGAVRRPPTAGATAGIISGGATPERAFKIIPDERTNSLILLAGPPEMRRIKDLITRLDVPLPLGTERIHVYYLKYANALEMVTVLSGLIGGGGGGGFGGTGGGFGFGGIGSRGGFGLAGSRGGFAAGGQTGFGGSFGGFGGFGGSSLSGGLGVSGQRGTAGFVGGGGPGGFTAGGVRRAGAPSFGGVAAGGQGGGEFQGEIRMTADPATNAIIINASPQDFETLKDVIEKLDVRRRQVYVEAIIAEVSLDKTRELGIELQGATTLNNGVALGRTNLSGDINQLLQPQNLSGLILAAVSSQTVTVNGVTVPAQQAILRALEQDNDSNILSAPTVVTTDNQPAEIVAGQNLPFIASRSTSETNLANTFATIERRDVGITLRITPQISEGGSVRLDIFQEVSDVISTDPQLGPTTTIRSATTTVVAKDGQTVVIGGLISDVANKSQTRVPFISDIPVIGHFFTFESIRNRKANLLIFLTPRIIRNEREQRDISVSERYRIIQRPFEEHGKRAPSWEPLYRPSWEVRPSLEEEPAEKPETPETSSLQEYKPQREEAPSGRTTVPGTEKPGGAAAPRAASGSDIYVLLATIWESGTPPSSLTGSNGLLALAVPVDSPLGSVFRKGEGYRFETEGYTAYYECLEVFPTPQEAFAGYPEGMQVSNQPPTFLRWREPSEAAALNTPNWTEVGG